jgi:hypothetical protein
MSSPKSGSITLRSCASTCAFMASTLSAAAVAASTVLATCGMQGALGFELLVKTCHTGWGLVWHVSEGQEPCQHDACCLPKPSYPRAFHVLHAVALSARLGCAVLPRDSPARFCGALRLLGGRAPRRSLARQLWSLPKPSGVRYGAAGPFVEGSSCRAPANEAKAVGEGDGGGDRGGGLLRRLRTRPVAARDKHRCLRPCIVAGRFRRASQWMWSVALPPVCDLCGLC